MARALAAALSCGEKRPYFLYAKDVSAAASGQNLSLDHKLPAKPLIIHAAAGIAAPGIAAAIAAYPLPS